jgi:imidazolonepropionase-like amidohydrolase
MLIKNVRIITCTENAGKSGAIAGAKENTGPGEIEKGWILSEDGIILELGDMDSLPSYSGESIDASGCTVIPGLIDAHCHIGLQGEDLTTNGQSLSVDGDLVTPQLRAIDAIDPLDPHFAKALAAGITTVVTGPSSSNLIGGRFVALHTSGRRVDKMVVQDNVSIKFTLGDHPKQVLEEGYKTPMNRMAEAALLREYLFKANEYALKKDAAVRDDDAEDPLFDIKLEALMPVVKKEMKVYFHAGSLNDVYTAIRIATEFDLDYTLLCTDDINLEAESLASERITVITCPKPINGYTPESESIKFEGLDRLAKAGVRMAISTGHPSVPISYLPHCAAQGIKCGMDKDYALRSVAIHAAQSAGIEERVGSIEPGKRCDLVVFESNPFDMDSRIRMVIIDGEIVFCP